MEIETLLNLLMEEVAEEFVALKNIEVGSEEYKKAIEGLTKLNNQIIEVQKMKDELEYKEKHYLLDTDKANKEYEIKQTQQLIDNENKEKQFVEEKKNNMVKDVLNLMAIIVPAGLTIWGTIKSIKFESTGTITTIMGRGFIQKMLPKK